MLKTSSRLPISAVNSALIGTLFAGAVITALTHNWLGAILLFAGGLFGLGGALYARRSNSRDITRLNAIEYRDERDRLLATRGFATVGAAALLLSVLEVVLAVIFGQLVAVACAQLIALSAVWSVANSMAVKRS